MVEFPPEFHTTPLGYYVWSRSPRAGHVLAFAIAKFADPAFRWISVRELPKVPAEEERWIERLLPKNQVLEPVSPADLGKSPRVARKTFDSTIREEGAGAERIALDHFFLLPQRLQRIFDEPHPSSAPRAIVVANTNRVRDFYPTDPDRLRVFTEVFPRVGISIITTSIPPPFRGRYGFDIVLRLDVASAADWRNAHVVVEKGTRSGEFQTGVTLSPEQLPSYLALGDAVDKLPK
jgi:hypothetical protein